VGIVRQIGEVDLLIECESAHGLYFEEGFLEKNGVTSSELSQIEICQLLSKNKFRPLYLMWELLDRCNFSCPFCYIVGHSDNKIIRFSEAKPQIDYLIEKGLLYCLLSGGEPTIHPDFISIYKHLKKSGVITEVYSNGAQLEEKHFKLFRKYPPYKLEITIYGLSDKIFKKNTGSKYVAKTILTNIIRMKENGVNVVCKTPVNSLTMVEFDEIQSWCKENNITHYHSTDISMSYDNDPLEKYIAPEEIKIKYDTQNEINFVKNFGKQKNGNVKLCFSCAVGSYGIHINSNFELQPCSSFNGKMKGYNIRTLGIDKSLILLRRYINSQLDNPILGCVGCDSSSYCKMCPALAEPVYKNDKVIGYKTNTAYCENIKMIHKNILINTVK